MCIRNAKISSSSIKSTVSKNNVFLVFATVFYPRTYIYGALFNGIYQSGNKCKTENVHKKIYRVGHERIYSREYGKCAGLKGADEEHIEFNFGLGVVHNGIEQKRYSREHGEYHHRPSEEAFVQVMAVVCYKENTNSELQAVVNHGLNIYAYDKCENVAGVYHYNKTRK